MIRVLFFLWCFPSALVGSVLGSLIVPWLRPLWATDGACAYAVIGRGARLFGWGRGWAGLTLAPWVFIRADVADRTAVLHHELSHVRQAWRWGPLYLPVYGLLWLLSLMKHRSAQAAYDFHPWEVEARLRATVETGVHHG